MKRDKLTIEQHDDDTVTIEGTRYANSFFRELGCSFPDMVGQTLRVEQKKDGVVWLARVDTALNIYRTDKPGLYIVHLQEHVIAEARNRIRINIERLLSESTEGPKVLIIGPEADYTVQNEYLTFRKWRELNR